MLRCTLLALILVTACDKPAPSPEPPVGGDPTAADPSGPPNPDPTAPADPTDASAGDPPSDPAKCGDETCTDGKTCVDYYGIAGPSGPQFHSCEWPCDKKQACPSGTKCITIADGPGQVCR